MNALPVRASAITLSLLGVMVACDAEHSGHERAKEPIPRVERTLSFVTQLRSLPMPASDEAMYISVADLRALSAANGVAIPERTDEPAVLEWTRVLAGNGTTPSVAAAELPWLIRGEPTAFMSETGLSAADFRMFASLITTPEEFTVVRGTWAGITPARSLTPVEDGIVSVGKGDDYVASRGVSVHGADFYGRPVRLARVADRIALSLSTPMTRRWRDGRGPTLADDPALLAIGQRLDQTDVLSAYLVAPSTDDGAYGIGWAVDKGAPQIVGVYDGGCVEGAKRMVEPLREAFSGPMRLKSISAEGRTVLATLTLGRSATVLTPLEALEHGKWPLAPVGATAIC
ncbi:MAG TPA: hypothetical protein VFO49_08445 [Nocardioides sp.]|nr:hypothetical protein [Nocardioides sp.]